MRDLRQDYNAPKLQQPHIDCARRASPDNRLEQWTKKTMIFTGPPSRPRNPRKSPRRRRASPAATSPWTRAQTRATTTTATRYVRQGIARRPRLTRLQDLEFIIDKPATAAKPAPCVYYSMPLATGPILTTMTAHLKRRKTKQSRLRLQPSPRPHHNRHPANKHGRRPGLHPRSPRYQDWATQPSTHPT